MINLAIVIAVSEYSAPTGNLPACSRDGEVVAKLLRSDSKFGDVLVIDKNTRSSAVKQQIIEFVSRHNSSEVGELFFYFTGHGQFSGNDFFYLLSDYESRRQNQTALANSEFDNLARSLKPTLFVKIVDACNSGVTYIKNPEDFRTYLKDSGGEFKKLYFMYSSQSDQFSYQDSNLSYFTRRIIDSILGHDAKSIRYKDIIDYVSDSFEGDGAQTPFFVTQAEFTELFSDKVLQLKDAIGEYANAPDPQRVLSLSTAAPSLVELVKRDAELYCSQEEAVTRVEQTLKIAAKVKIPDDLAQLYTFETVAEIKPPPNSSSIGLWLDKNKDPRGYFFSVTKETRPFVRRIPKDRLSLAALGAIGIGGDDDYKTVTENREVVTGYQSTMKLPFDFIAIPAEPRFPNLNPATCFIAPLLSRTHVRFFWAFTFYEFIDWKDRKRVGKIEWATEEVLLRSDNAMNELVDSIVSKFFQFIEAPIRAKWQEVDKADVKDE